MKLIALLLAASQALANQTKQVYLVNGEPITKLQTIVLLAQDQTKKVYRCTEVTLDKTKVTLKPVK
jgi:hypothetical protein